MKVRTYDIVNAGPRNRFMANGRIVSNSSHGAQLHNLPRHNPRFENPRQLLQDVNDGADIAHHGSALKIVSELLRPLLIAAPGHCLITADYAQIEARVLAWLAGQDDRLTIFRAYDSKTGPDPYRVTAGRIYQVPPSEITAAQRQIGKVSDLALGYQGGAKAFRSMAKNFGLQIEDAQAEQVKLAWRAAHPYIQQFWYDLNAAARECLVQPPGATLTVGRIAFRRGKQAMTMRLPSGRCLVYWNPSLKQVETPWGELTHQMHYWSQDAVTRQWCEFKMYGGLATENAVQATARDIMADALVRLDAASLNPVLTVHDEVLCETDASNIAAVKEIMMNPPSWADGLPVAIDIGAATRYLK